MTDEQFIETVTANAHATAAVAVLLRHVLFALSQQPQIDKELLKNHLSDLPVPSSDDVFVEVYSKLKENLVQDLSK